MSGVSPLNSTFVSVGTLFSTALTLQTYIFFYCVARDLKRDLFSVASLLEIQEIQWVCHYVQLRQRQNKVWAPFLLLLEVAYWREKGMGQKAKILVLPSVAMAPLCLTCQWGRVLSCVFHVPSQHTVASHLLRQWLNSEALHPGNKMSDPGIIMETLPRGAMWWVDWRLGQIQLAPKAVPENVLDCSLLKILLVFLISEHTGRTRWLLQSY